MKCYLRRLTYVVSLLLLVSTALSGSLDKEKVEELVKEELHLHFKRDVRLKNLHVFLRKPIEFVSIDRKVLSVRRGEPRGNFHLYLKTKRGFRRITASLELEWKCSLIVAQEDLLKGERVYPWQVAYEERFMGRCPRQDIEPTEELINYVVLRTVKKGEVLVKSYLKKEPLVRRGQEVSVIYRSGNLEISFNGKALDTGFYGDVIRVRSFNTGKLLRGRVISEGSVLLK